MQPDGTLHDFYEGHLRGNRYHEACGMDNVRLWKPIPDAASTTVDVVSAPSTVDTGIIAALAMTPGAAASLAPCMTVR